MQRLRGKGRFQFGKVELANTLNWQGLAFSIAAVAITWGTAELVPYLEDQAGWVAAVGGIAAIALRAAAQWVRDNEQRFN